MLKKTTIVAGVLLACCACSLAASADSIDAKTASRAWDDPSLSADERARLMVEAMTLDEQISLLRTQAGFGLLSLGVPLPPTVPESMRKHTPKGALGSAGFVEGVPRVGMPAQQMSDASLGVANLGGFLRRGDEATSLPASLALAATFDLDLAREAGAMLGAEAHAKGFNIQLAGGVNLTREPRNGRNFEYAGEDPLLAGLIIGEQIAGIQSRHVVSTAKHYALNSQETGRFVHDAVIDEAALRESDLLAFQIALERGKPGAVMCAYNLVNGPFACENEFLLQDVLKGEWGFPGWIMSDWGAVHSLKASLDAGLDQESPQDDPYFDELKDAVVKGEISRERVAEAARRIVRSFLAVGAIDHPAQPSGAIDQAAHAQIAERVALNGMVLLKNDGVLPLAQRARRIAVIGGFADRGVLSGGGSSQVMPYGGHFLDKRGREGIAAFLAPVYGLSSPLLALRELRPDADIRFDDGVDVARAAELARSVDVAIVFATRPEEEGMDAPDLSLPHGQDALIAAVAAKAKKTIVVLETGNPVAMPWLGEVSAVLQAWYPGQRGGQAIAKILTGAASPSGRLPITFPASVEQLPRPAIPGFDRAPRTPFGLGASVEPFAVEFNEGSDVGYRWFERTGVAPLFAFGHGLTYTTFAYDKLKLAGGADLRATFTLKNTGKRAGVEVAQLYAAPPGRTHRLVGWVRVALESGEAREVTVSADPRLLASYEAGGWRRHAGEYSVYVGRAAGQRDLSGRVALSAQTELPAAVQTTVTTEGGAVRGAIEEGLLVFKGVPYARAPLGELRWRAPQPVQAWSSVRDATTLAPDCMQAPFGPAPASGRHPVSEDCLYLNIWRPNDADRKLPVMVWIHGGGFVNGGSSSRDSTGEAIAARGVLFVSFNYRLGRFGFFGFPALNQEHTEKAKGNYGLMDQIAALQWIRRNIDDFGGDAQNVTVVGESAGGISINMLLTAPAATGLFDRAIVQSGGGRKLVRPRTLVEDLPDAPSAMTLGVAFARKQGVSGVDAAALRQLRGLSAEQITSGLNMASLLFRDAALFSGPVVDGKLIVETPEAAFTAGRQQRVPLIIGATSSDLGLNRARTVDEAFAAFGARTEAARRAYDAEGRNDLDRINNAIGADHAMVEPARFIARSMSRLHQPVYAYRFSYVLDAKRGEAPFGAPHASDVPFAFDRLEQMHGAAVSAADARVADAMADYWVQFAKTSDPNGSGRTAWPTYEEAQDVILEFRADGTIAAVPDPWRDRLDLTQALSEREGSG